MKTSQVTRVSRPAASRTKTRSALTSSAPMTAPTSIAATAPPRRQPPVPSPPASCESAASPVSVRVSTVVLRSATLSRRTVALRTPIAKASRPMIRSPEKWSGVMSKTIAISVAKADQPDLDDHRAAEVGLFRRQHRRHPAADHGADEEGEQRDQRRHHRQPGRADDAEAEQHHVAGHVGGEDAAEAEVTGGVDHAGRQRQDEQRTGERMADRVGARHPWNFGGAAAFPPGPTAHDLPGHGRLIGPSRRAARVVVVDAGLARAVEALRAWSSPRPGAGRLTHGPSSRRRANKSNRSSSRIAATRPPDADLPCPVTIIPLWGSGPTG